MTVFRHAQKVTPIDNEPWEGTPDMPAMQDPEHGKVYTVKKVCHILNGWEPIRAIILYELRPDIAYDASRFRPVCDRKTSIEVFKKAPKPVLEDA